MALQSLGNPAWVCHCCKSFVGGPYAALKILATQTLPNVDELSVQDQQQSFYDDDDGNNNEDQSSWDVIPCRQNCGQVYCSKECEEDFWQSRHRFLCTGKLSDNCPLVKFKQYAMQTNEIFLLVAEWIAAAYTYKKSREDSLLNNDSEKHDEDPFEDFLMEPWWELGDPQSDGQKAEGDILKKLCEEACHLWRQHWEVLKEEEKLPQQTISDITTPLYMANIIGACELNSIGIRRRSPLCRDVFSRKLRQDCKHLLLKCIQQAGMLWNDDDVDSEADEAMESSITVSTTTPKSEEEKARATRPDDEFEYTDDDLARFLSELDIFEEETTKKSVTKVPTSSGDNDGEECEDCEDDQDDLDDIFPPMDGTAMYALTCKMNHSCDPNVVVLYKTRGWGAKHPLVAHCIALRDIEQGEELCISYIESNDHVTKRQEALKHYGFLCNCSKCQTELLQGTTLQSQEENPASERESDDLLFGSDDSEDECVGATTTTSENGLTQGSPNKLGLDAFIDGETAIERCLGRLDTVLNNFSMGSIPLPYLAQASTFVIQTARSAQANLQEKNKDELVVKDLLSKCASALSARDFVLCKTVGSDLEHFLFSMLQKYSKWPALSFREAYWCATMTSSVGLAHQCSFLPAMNFLDKGTLLGLERCTVDDFYSYVEYHACQVAMGPFEPAVGTVIPDFNSPSYENLALSTGLSQSIQFPLPEVDESTLDSIYIPKSQSAVVRGYAMRWPAIRLWRYVLQMSLLVIRYLVLHLSLRSPEI